MAGVKRLLITIQRNTYDLWHIASVEAEEEYSDTKNAMVYIMVLNKTAVARDIKEARFIFDTEAARDAEIDRINHVLRTSGRFHFIGDSEARVDEEEGSDDDFDYGEE